MILFVLNSKRFKYIRFVLYKKDKSFKFFVFNFIKSIEISSSIQVINSSTLSIMFILNSEKELIDLLSISIIFDCSQILRFLLG